MLHSLQARLLSANPLVAAVKGFLTEAECADLIALANGKMAPAQVMVDKGEVGVSADVSPSRTNSECFLNPEVNPQVLSILDRIAAVVKLPHAHGENLSVLHYAHAEEFKPHVDGIWSGSNADATEVFTASGGQRLFTTMIYLNKVAEGGATVFPSLGFRVTPSPGLLLVFANTAAGSDDQTPLAAHAGEPVTNGEKWVAVTWWRERPAGPSFRGAQTGG